MVMLLGKAREQGMGRSDRNYLRNWAWVACGARERFGIFQWTGRRQVEGMRHFLPLEKKGKRRRREAVIGRSSHNFVLPLGCACCVCVCVYACVLTWTKKWHFNKFSFYFGNFNTVFYINEGPIL
ncbi:hypothetical protein M433DRAFT_184193 [Acidomyces richmondensis BFW]|nr:MAG: hypothetical protein FE78DRAFT_366563 [Acidomyces sp. 'richmondensis']KYG40735.1 hypothetical protein M433DRAFT_184193 [Acidomyces richmondensis BFW]